MEKYNQKAKTHITVILIRRTSWVSLKAKL